VRTGVSIPHFGCTLTKVRKLCMSQKLFNDNGVTFSISGCVEQQRFIYKILPRIKKETMLLLFTDTHVQQNTQPNVKLDTKYYVSERLRSASPLLLHASWGKKGF
jgi:hypothetical protein